MSEHTISSKTYYGIWILLLILTGLTAWIATVDLGPLNTVVALAIASVKATVVALFFMHVKYASEKMTKVVIISALFWMMILLTLSLTDYVWRLAPGVN
jgi:cytochrome c oxidase subunit 4